jgi:hypothetical protein
VEGVGWTQEQADLICAGEYAPFVIHAGSAETLCKTARFSGLADVTVITVWTSEVTTTMTVVTDVCKTTELVDITVLEMVLDRVSNDR